MMINRVCVFVVAAVGFVFAAAGAEVHRLTYCARGGYVVDCAWKDGRPVSAKAVPVNGVMVEPKFFFKGEVFK